MCRHLAYLGEPVCPAEPVFTAGHSLLAQSYAPRDMRGGGTVNADGFGLGWFASDGRPVRYRRPSPLWTDESLPRLAETVRSGAFLGAVRSGTAGMPVTEAACAPFADEHWLFSHNGVVRGWPGSVAGLAEKLPVADLLRIEAPTDSALLWTLLRERLREGADPVDAVAGLVTDVERAAPGSRLNLLLVGADVLVGTAWTHALSVCAKDGGALVASEPHDAHPAWRPVPDRHLVVVRRGRPPTVEPLSADTAFSRPGSE
ncbi:ergothioneine biosynthesis protein EgtC [Prauserella muralis]|uniref:Gamma-glutamyl-hercynylcysteine sulfoxide hydrolase n=1 Tax=Prauserella muralis TaxID=588067 RepID=A0A2V4AP58_9PSEU|nr:ergothioneine biosynthesis protein EgtC [Prauserella muralis]PXY22392.1 ergothioneine biosynthesis protein EgtC [Prauserella muralis]TWE28052.1 glutamine amidotransferase [Prauserella muralis]